MAYTPISLEGLPIGCSEWRDFQILNLVGEMSDVITAISQRLSTVEKLLLAIVSQAS